MRVLIVTQYFWPEPFRINDLAQGLGQRGHDVTVLTGLPNYPEGRLYSGYHLFSWHESLANVKIKRVPLIPRGCSNGLRLATNYLSFAASAALLGTMRCRGPYDVIFVFEPSPITVGLPAVALKWRHRIPIVFWVQDLWPETLSAAGAVSSRRVMNAVDCLARWIYAGCDRILVQSRAFVPYVKDQGVPTEKIHYFPNWAEGFFRPVLLSPDASEQTEMPDGFRILFAGNIGASQSFATILDAAQRTRHIPEIKWVVLGDGRERQWVERQVASRQLGETVSLLGRRPVETMPRYFAAADALLVTLKREPVFALTIPSKVQSYLACGKPILGSLDGEGAAIIRESEAGLVAPAETGQALADCAVDLYRSSPERRAAMGSRGRKYFEHNFDRELLLDRLDDTFLEVTAATKTDKVGRRAA